MVVLLAFADTTVVGGMEGAMVAVMSMGMSPGDCVAFTVGVKEGSVPLTMLGAVVMIEEPSVPFPLGTSVEPVAPSGVPLVEDTVVSVGAAAPSGVPVAGDAVMGGNVVVLLGAVDTGFVAVVPRGADELPMTMVGDPVMFELTVGSIEVLVPVEVGIIVLVEVTSNDGS
jgi:hypothetical protein